MGELRIGSLCGLPVVLFRWARSPGISYYVLLHFTNIYKYMLYSHKEIRPRFPHIQARSLSKTTSMRYIWGSVDWKGTKFTWQPKARAEIGFHSAFILFFCASAKGVWPQHFQRLLPVLGSLLGLGCLGLFRAKPKNTNRCVVWTIFRSQWTPPSESPRWALLCFTRTQVILLKIEFAYWNWEACTGRINAYLLYICNSFWGVPQKDQAKAGK